MVDLSALLRALRGACGLERLAKMERLASAEDVQAASLMLKGARPVDGVRSTAGRSIWSPYYHDTKMERGRLQFTRDGSA